MAISKSLQRAWFNKERPESYVLLNSKGEEIHTVFPLKTITTIWSAIDFYNKDYKELFANNKNVTHRLGAGVIKFVHIKSGRVKISFIFDSEEGFIYHK